MSVKVIVTGATGLIGKHLVYALMREGHQVVAFARSIGKLPELPNENVYTWSHEKLPPAEALINSDVVIHLAGEGIADRRWTAERKQKIWDSRVVGTKNLVKALSLLPENQRPKVLISGSAIGYYAQSSRSQDESSGQGKEFLSNLCIEWETAALESEKLGLRTVLVRSGLVLAKEGGVLSKMGPITLGRGQQYMSWIHIDDLVGFILFALNNSSIKGPFNLTAPSPVTNKEFTKTFSKIKGYPITLFAPKSILKLVLGELSEAVLANQKIVPRRALSLGFNFKYENLEPALQDLLGNSSMLENFFLARQFVPQERQRVFSFFSKAENLEILTPPWLHFHILKKSTPEIQKGTVIDYRLNIHGIPVKWRTLIQDWNSSESFVDFQLKGPYRKWHHLHTFEDVPGGTLISDKVTFEIPGWIFGKFLLPLIRKDVQEIFHYRQNKIRDLYTKNNL